MAEMDDTKRDQRSRHGPTGSTNAASYDSNFGNAELVYLFGGGRQFYYPEVEVLIDLEVAEPSRARSFAFNSLSSFGAVKEIAAMTSP
jgi:hypothetical protein